jgi:cyclophilin family peptidyl-prolyl cis-trans isomerase
MARSTVDAKRRVVRTMAFTVLALLLLLAPPPSSGGPAPPPQVFQVRVETTQGAFVVEAHPEWAPQGVAHFRELVASKYFDDSRFFRVVARFIAQFGIAGDPKVTAAWKERTIPDDPVRQSNLRGTLAFAMTGPGTRSTQIYINLTDNARLDAQGFAPIGRVISGLDVVDRLYAGYGEGAGGGMRGGQQGKMLAGGNAYLDASFPKLDRLVRARIVAGTEVTGYTAFSFRGNETPAPFFPFRLRPSTL